MKRKMLFISIKQLTTDPQQMTHVDVLYVYNTSELPSTILVVAEQKSPT